MASINIYTQLKYGIPTLALSKSGSRSKVTPSSQPVYKLPSIQFSNIMPYFRGICNIFFHSFILIFCCQAAPAPRRQAHLWHQNKFVLFVKDWAYVNSRVFDDKSSEPVSPYDIVLQSYHTVAMVTK